MIPRDIHRAISLLLEESGRVDVSEETDASGELEHAWNLVREWWEVEPMEDRNSGVDPYPESS
jgi:hypothetical protein